jgi:hypothetical protein
LRDQEIEKRESALLAGDVPPDAPTQFQRMWGDMSVFLDEWGEVLECVREKNGKEWTVKLPTTEAVSSKHDGVAKPYSSNRRAARAE